MPTSAKKSKSIYYKALEELGGCATSQAICNHMRATSDMGFHTTRRIGKQSTTPQMIASAFQQLKKAGKVKCVSRGVWATTEWPGSMPWESKPRLKEEDDVEYEF